MFPAQPGMFLLIIAALGAAVLIAAFWAAYLRRHYPALRFLIVAVVVFILMLGTLLANRIDEFEHAELNKEVRVIASHLAFEVDNRLRDRMHALERMANRWENDAYTSKSIWMSDAQAYVADFPEHQALEWVDAPGRIQWVVPQLGNERDIGYNLGQESRRRALLAEARGAGGVVISEQIDLLQGGGGFLMARAVHHRGAHQGYLLAVLRTEPLFRDLLGENVPPGIGAGVTYHGRRLLLLGDEAGRTDYLAQQTLAFDPAWQITVTPTADFVAKVASGLPLAVLTTTVVMALLAAWALGLMVLAMKRADRSRAAEAALRDREARLAAVVNTALDGIITIDRSGKISSCNPAVERMFGYGATELVGRNVSMLMPEPFRSHHDGYLQRYHPERVSKVIGKVLEVIGQRKDGSTLPLELSVNAMEVEGALMFVGMLRDISARKEAEAKLIRARDEAERASQVKTEFLSSMSHELRTPMNAILGFGQLLQLERSLDASQRESVQEIVKAGNHLLSLINDVLDLSRVESGGMSVSLDRVEVAALFDECEKLIAAFALERHVSLKCERASCAGLAVRADHTRLKQALLNLLTNAVKYNRSDGSVTLSCRSEAGKVRVLVQDTGHGIPDEKIVRLFQPFDRLGAEMSAIEGTGIGLALTRKLVEMMGGTVGVESTVGVGSAFWIELPAAGTVSLPAAAKGGAVAALPEVSGKAGKTVLYVEDNVANLHLMRHVFAQRTPWRLVDAESAEQALPLLRALRPDAILLDINLPGMDGYDLLAQLRRMPGLDSVPVVAVSANAMGSDIARAMEAGFDDYLTKPIDVAKLLQVLGRLLASDGTGVAT